MKTMHKFVFTVTVTVFVLVAADLQAGRWLSRDPITENAGFVARDAQVTMNFIQRNGPSLYAFTRNNPVMMIDPLGLDTLLLIIGEEFNNQSDVFRRSAAYYISTYKNANFDSKCDAVVTVDLTGTGENAVRIVQTAFSKVKSIRIIGYLGHSGKRNLFLTEQPSKGANLGLIDVDENRSLDDPDRTYYATSISHLDFGNLTKNASVYLLSCQAGAILAPEMAKRIDKPVLATPSYVNFDSRGRAFIRLHRSLFTGGWKWNNGSPKKGLRDEVWSQESADKIQQELNQLINSLKAK
ncbi:MAG: hypothetical protein WCO56_16180 [Verrucomicrobiota bacterium]